MAWNQEYTPFGEQRLSTTGDADNIGYTGHVQDHASGLTYMQARYYDPVIGRFLSTDPIGYQDQMNLYAYVHNDPVNAVDPNGEFANFLVGAVIGVVVEGVSIAADGGNPLDVKANAARYASAGAIGAVSSGVGAIVGKQVAGQAGKTILREVGKRGGGTVGAVGEGTVSGASAGAIAETLTQVSETGAITDSSAIAKAALVGGVVGGTAGGVQQSVQNGLSAASGRGAATGENLATNNYMGLSNSLANGREGVSGGALAGAGVNAAAGVAEQKGFSVNISEGNGKCSQSNPCSD